MLLVLITSNLEAQEPLAITVEFDSTYFSFPRIGSCTFRSDFTPISGMADITYDVDGNIYLLEEGVYPVLLSYNPLTGDTTHLYDFPLGNRLNSMTTNADNVALITGFSGDFWEFDFNTLTPSYIGNTGIRSFGDMTFYEGTLYLTQIDPFRDSMFLIQIDLTNVSESVVLFGKSLADPIYALLSYSESCDDVAQLYGLGFDSTYLIDFENKDFVAICAQDRAIHGVASLTEIRASRARVSIEAISSTAEHCGLRDGTILINVRDGLSPYLYTLDEQGITQRDPLFTNLRAGVYPITVIDSFGCSVTDTVLVARAPEPAISHVEFIPATCDLENGGIIVHTTEESPPVVYAANDGDFQLDSTITNLPPGPTRIYIKSAAGCLDSTVFSIPEVSRPEILEVVTFPVTCNSTNGAFTILGEGFNVEYAIDTTEFQSSGDFNNLLSGSYTLYVRDAFGCIDSAVAIIDSLPPPSILDNTVMHTTCAQDNGAAIIDAIGASALRYSIDDLIYADSSSIIELTAGEYLLRVSDSLGCTTLDSFTILPSSTVELQVAESTPIRCGTNLGSVRLETSGGSPAYEYAIEDSSFTESSIFTELLHQSYQFYARDQDGCTDSILITIDSLPYVSIDSVIVTPTLCERENGTAQILFTSPSIMSATLDGTAVDPIEIIPGLTTGTYNILLEDEMGCRDSTQFVIAPSSIKTPTIADVTHSTCHNDNGIVRFDKDDNLIVYINESQQGLMDNTLSGLVEGTYQIRSIDENGCEWDSSFVIRTTDTISILSYTFIDPTDCSTSDGAISVELADSGALQSVYINDQLAASLDMTGLEEGLQVVRLIDTATCQSSLEVLLDLQDCPIYFPNVFSPNNDGINDSWDIYTGPEFSTTSMQVAIYDRWGNVVYRYSGTSEMMKGWDGAFKGRSAPAGVYTVAIQFLDRAGQPALLSGDVTLIK